MTEHDIKGKLRALRGAIENNDTGTAQECALTLLEVHLLTQVRIAETLEDIRAWGIAQSKQENP